MGNAVTNLIHGNRRTSGPIVHFCEESRRLLDAFGDAVQDLVLLHEQQFLAIVDGDPDPHRFDLLVHMATEKKQAAKYAYLEHQETHGC